MRAKQTKRRKLSGTIDIKDGTKGAADNFTSNGLEYSVLSNEVILDNIMRYLTYKDIQRLSQCCRTVRDLSAMEFHRRKRGLSSIYLLFRSKNLTVEPFRYNTSDEAGAIVYMGVEKIQQKLSDAIDQLHFRPKIAFLLTGNVKSQDHQMWTKWFKRRLPSNCTIMSVLSKTAISGSINEHVYEVHQATKDDNCGLAYLLFGTHRPAYDVKVFKGLKELASLTEGKTISSEPVKCILYFSRSSSRAKLSKILSVCKESNNNCSIAFGGLVVDSLASFATDAYTSKIECAGLVFSGSDIVAASTIIEDMNDEQIRDAMIRFRDSILFDINDTTKNTICFLLSCIEHSPNVNYSSEYTTSESSIFHTIFPSNVKAFGLSGHGEFGQVSGVMEDQNKISYQFSCVMVLVQFPMK